MYSILVQLQTGLWTK